MNREQIIQMARDAGFGHYDDYSSGWKDTLDRFAYAVRLATKEEDAKICDELANKENERGRVFTEEGHLNSAKAIRASK